MKFVPARDYFFEKIGEVLEKEDIYIVSSDLAGRPFDYIRQQFPTRYVPVGIAEQNMISVACGIAMSGKKTIAYAANPFIAFHAFDQVRNGASLMRIPMVIAGFGVGFGVSVCGPTHYITEDFAMMSLCPNMRIITVSDNNIAARAFEQFLQRPALTYLRFDKQCGGELAPVTAEDWENGFRWLRRGTGELTLATGYMAQLACGQAGDGAVIDVFSYPFDVPAFLAAIKGYKTIIVYEEQQTRGGLGSALLEILNREQVDTSQIKIELRGVRYGDAFPETYGSREYWLKKYGLL